MFAIRYIFYNFMHFLGFQRLYSFAYIEHFMAGFISVDFDHKLSLSVRSSDTGNTIVIYTGGAVVNAPSIMYFLSEPHIIVDYNKTGFSIHTAPTLKRQWYRGNKEFF